MRTKDIALAAGFALSTVPANAQLHSWIDPGFASWSSQQSWSPFGVPNSPNAQAWVGLSPNVSNQTVKLDMTVKLAALSISDGMSVWTNTYTLDAAAGDVTIAGRNTLDGNIQYPSRLYIEGPDTTGAVLRDVFVEDGAKVTLAREAIVFINNAISIDGVSELDGVGEVFFFSTEGDAIINDGWIKAEGADGLHLNGVSSSTLDLDGVSENGRLTAYTESPTIRTELVVTGNVEPFGGSAGVGPGDTLRINSNGPFTLENGGSVTLEGDPARVAALEGSPWHVEGGIHSIGKTSYFTADQHFMPGSSTMVSGDGDFFLHGETTITGGTFNVIESSRLMFMNPGPQPFTGATFNLDRGWISGSGTIVTSDAPGGGAITGAGTVLLPIDNNGTISAVASEDNPDDLSFLKRLGLYNDDSDMDGSNDTGTLNAVEGNLYIITGEGKTFAGTANVGEDWGLVFYFDPITVLPPAVVNLDGGTFRSSVNAPNIFELEQLPLDFGGTLNVVSTGEIVADTTFKPTTQATLAGNLDFVGDTIIEPGATFTKSDPAGQITVPGDYTLTLKNASEIAVDVIASGTLRPGDGPGTAAVDGDVFVGGTLELEARAASPGLYDLLQVSGVLEARGTISVVSTGYIPQAGDVLDMLDFGAFVDLGYTLELPPLEGSLAWDTADFETDGVLRVVGVPCGPADLAEPFGLLDFFDVTEFLSEFGAGNPIADFNDDGQLNFFDVSAFIVSFNAGCP